MEMNLEDYTALPQTVREKHPLIHCITNYVTAKDVANVVLACGGSPIMADHPAEVKEMTRLSDCLLLNIGTPRESTLDVMITELIQELVKKVVPTVVRGNASEIRTLLSNVTRQLVNESANHTSHLPRGVDASGEDQITEDNVSSFIEAANLLSHITSAVVVMTGATDIVAYHDQIRLVKNGCPEMSGITGSGCMLDGFLAAYAASSVKLFEAMTVATAIYGLCGENANQKTKECRGGSGSFHRYFMDEINLSSHSLQKGGLRIELP